MIEQLINRYKQYKKQQFYTTYTRYTGKYAFIGAGNHAISNLYPCIDFLNVPLKYIVTKNKKNADKMAVRYNAIGTDNVDEVLNDNEIKGVFISTVPEKHFSLCLKALKAGKHVFVEKPPCTNTNELNELIHNSKGLITCVGLQKRYANVYKKLLLVAKKATTYQYRYLTGAYPEGNALFDLFIHPIDLAIYLFGKVETVNKVTSTNKKTIFLQTVHTSGCVGQIELSTDYNWKSPAETLTINTAKAVYDSKGIYDLRKTHKSAAIMGIPMEKVVKTPLKSEIIVDNNGFVPISENNQLYAHGYFPQISSFVEACESNHNAVTTPFDSLTDTFDMLKQIG